MEEPSYEGTLELCQRYVALRTEIESVEGKICQRTGYGTVDEFLDGMRQLLAPAEEMVASGDCTCGAKTMQQEYHATTCPVRVRFETARGGMRP